MVEEEEVDGRGNRMANWKAEGRVWRKLERTIVTTVERNTIWEISSRTLGRSNIGIQWNKVFIECGHHDYTDLYYASLPSKDCLSVVESFCAMYHLLCILFWLALCQLWGSGQQEIALAGFWNGVDSSLAWVHSYLEFYFMFICGVDALSPCDHTSVPIRQGDCQLNAMCGCRIYLTWS